MKNSLTTFDILYFIKYPPPYPQPTPNHFEPRSGAFFERAWLPQKIGVNFFRENENAFFPDKVQGVPVVLGKKIEDRGPAVFAPAWRVFAYSWEAFISSPDRILEDLNLELARTRTIEPIIDLDDRELDILRMIASGLTYSTIAKTNLTSTRTITTTISALKDKFDVDSVAGLIGRAVDLGIITTGDLFVDFPIVWLDK